MAAKPIRLKFNKRRIAGFTGNQLKMIALIFMLCEYIGYVLIENGVLYGQNPAYWSMALATPEGQRWYMLARVLRTLGRLAFPIYAFLTVEGVVHTGSIKKYVGRLIILAVISEVPFDLAIKGVVYDPEYQNVLFTLALGAVSAACMNRLRTWSLLIRLMIAGALCFLAYIIRSDYGAIGVAMISLMYLLREDRNVEMISGALLAAAESADYACSSALAFAFIYFYNGKRGEFGMKAFFYPAYPLMLLIFWAMVYFANR